MTTEIKLSIADVFKKIKDLKQNKKFNDAWEIGFKQLQEDPHNTYLKTSLFWVCYDVIKSIQNPVLERPNKNASQSELKIINDWIIRIGELNLVSPREYIDYRFLNLFKGCGEHYKIYIQMLVFYGTDLYGTEDFKPYITAKGEAPSTVTRLARQVAKSYLLYYKEWNLDIDKILNIINFAIKNGLDKNKIWLYYDLSKCLILAGRYQEAREGALAVLRKKMSESWAWSSLADTYETENIEASISCYCKGIQEAHEPIFAIPIYSSLAKLFIKQSNFQYASSSLCKLIEIYNSNNWKLKPEHEALIKQQWFTVNENDNIQFQKEIINFSKNAMLYVTQNLKTLTGVVESHHKSGKGFNIYVNSKMLLNVKKSVYFGKNLPPIGIWLEAKCAIDNDNIDVLEAKNINEQQNEKIVWVNGSLNLNPKGFGFIEEAFIPPHLLQGFTDGENVKALKIWSKAPKKLKETWRVIKILKV